MDSNMKSYFESLENDLREKKDRNEELDELFQQSFLGDEETKERVSWCVAKMCQNKCQDTRALDILIPLKNDENPQTRENVAWGIGEIAGAGICDDRCIDAIIELMNDDVTSIRGMAVWAAGRMIHKIGIKDERMISVLNSLKDDDSEFVRKSVDFALE